MAILKLFTFTLVLCLLRQRTAGNLMSVFPSDTEARIGQTVTMYCRIIHAVGSDIEWHHTPYGLQKLMAVYLDGYIYSNYQDRFTVTGDAQQGERNLRISNVSFEDAGKYTCMHQTESQTAELIVFATFPSSQSCAAVIPNDGLIGSNVCRLEPDNINISCNYSFRGNLVPAVEWKDGDGSLLQSIFTYRADVNTSTLIHKALKDDTITARIKYLSSDFLSKFTWKVSITVQNISHDETVQKIGCDSQIIHCGTRLPYQCTVEWKSSKHGILPNATLYTAELSNSVYTCSARCNIRGRTCSVKQSTVELNCPKSSASAMPPSNPSESGVDIVAVVVPLVIVIIIIGAAVPGVFFIRRFWRRKQSRIKKAINGRPTTVAESDQMLRTSQDKPDEELDESVKDHIEHKDVLLEPKLQFETDNKSIGSKSTEGGMGLWVDPLASQSKCETDITADVQLHAQDNTNTS